MPRRFFSLKEVVERSILHEGGVFIMDLGGLTQEQKNFFRQYSEDLNALIDTYPNGGVLTEIHTSLINKAEKEREMDQ